MGQRRQEGAYIDTDLNVSVQLSHDCSYVPDMFFQELPGQTVASPFVLHSVQGGDDVFLDAKGVFHKSSRCLLMAENPVF